VTKRTAANNVAKIAGQGQGHNVSRIPRPQRYKANELQGKMKLATKNLDKISEAAVTRQNQVAESAEPHTDNTAPPADDYRKKCMQNQKEEANKKSKAIKAAVTCPIQQAVRTDAKEEVQIATRSRTNTRASIKLQGNQNAGDQGLDVFDETPSNQQPLTTDATEEGEQEVKKKETSNKYYSDPHIRLLISLKHQASTSNAADAIPAPLSKHEPVTSKSSHQFSASNISARRSSRVRQSRGELVESHVGYVSPAQSANSDSGIDINSSILDSFFISVEEGISSLSRYRPPTDDPRRANRRNSRVPTRNFHQCPTH
jgi:hypothetical protein